MNVREHILERLHERVGVCMTCGKQGCTRSVGANTQLPFEIHKDDILWAINLDGFFDPDDAGRAPKS